MSGVERRLRSAFVRADIARSTGVRHAWRRWRYDAAYVRQAAQRRQTVTAGMWREAAEAVGATIVALSPPFAEIRRDGATTRVMGETTALNNLVSVGLADDKPLVHRLLSDAGLATPEHVVVGEWSSAAAFLARADRPCVVKPAQGSGGDGVTGEIRRPAQLRRAAREARRHHQQLLVERHVPGGVYRVLVLDGEVLDVVRRRLPCVQGDGHSTIAQLIAVECERRLASDAYVPAKPFVVDLDSIFTLEAAGLHLGDVLPAGRTAIVKTVSNYNRPDDNEVVSQSEHRSFKTAAAKAASVLGLRLAGVDIVAGDPPASGEGGVILEVNGRPALHHHQHVANRGDGIPIAARLLDALLCTDESQGSDPGGVRPQHFA